MTAPGIELRTATLAADDVVIRASDAEDLRHLLAFIFAKHVHAGPGATGFPGMVHGRTFPEWLALIGGPEPEPWSWEPLDLRERP